MLFVAVHISSSTFIYIEISRQDLQQVRRVNNKLKQSKTLVLLTKQLTVPWLVRRKKNKSRHTMPSFVTFLFETMILCGRTYCRQAKQCQTDRRIVFVARSLYRIRMLGRSCGFFRHHETVDVASFFVLFRLLNVCVWLFFLLLLL